MFRLLKPEEIECRVSTVKKDGCSVLLYKDARCDMNILDETVGSFDWKREHTRDNANCIVSIWDKEKSQWISKEDTGTESNTEKEKGLASDSFKRACFNWGIGRELYTAPFIWINLSDKEVIQDGGKFKTYEKFTVQSITYKDKCIDKVTIIDKHGVVRFGKAVKPEPKTNSVPEEKKQWKKPTPQEELRDLAMNSKEKKIIWSEVLKSYNVSKISDLTEEQCQEIKGDYKL